MTDKKEQTKKIIWEHYQSYPKMQIKDIFKFLHQSAYGCEHLVTNEDAVMSHIHEEVKTYSFHRGALTEPLDGEFCRVHLDWIKDGLREKTLGRLFFFVC